MMNLIMKIILKPNIFSIIDVHPRQDQPKPNITFTHIDDSMHALDFPCYITIKINDKPTQGILIDLVCLVNVITKYFLCV